MAGLVHPGVGPRNVQRPVNLAYELPLGSVDSFEGIVRHVERATGILPAFGWQAGDANAPSYWLGAVNAIDRLAVTGVPVVGATPWELDDGTAVASEEYDGASYRSGGGAFDPSLSDDVVIVIVAKRGVESGAGNQYVLASRAAAAGWGVRWSGASTMALVWDADATVVAGATTVSPGMYSAFVCVVDRNGNILVYLNGTLVGSVACSAGSVASGAGIALAALANGGSPCVGVIDTCVVYYGAGIADVWDAALVQDVTARALGTAHRVGHAPSTFARNTAASWQDSHNRRHALASAGMPRAGSALAGAESGLRAAPARTNKSYANVNVTVAGAAVWTVDDASAVGRVDDSVALAAGAEPAEAWGPWTCRYDNATGAARYMYVPGNTANVNKHCLQVMARYTAGAGARLGLMDVSVGGAAGFTNLGAITDGYLRTQVHNVTPGDIDERLCIMLPNGCHLRWIAHDMQEGVRCTSPIPNWSTVAGAARAAEQLDTPALNPDMIGACEVGATPMGWDGNDNALSVYVLTRTGGSSFLLYAHAGIPRWASYDGTNSANLVAPAPADGVRNACRVEWGPYIRLEIDGAVASVPYDGAYAGAGTIRLSPAGGELAIDSLRVYRRLLP